MFRLGDEIGRVVSEGMINRNVINEWLIEMLLMYDE